ncbi:hypothetical protein B0H14DRAFT_3109751 [Mycena olivaceomarginata]|nr:hypothetical protein B0H14DRAFT_3109751 [Mycena olivaceomarginata]
MVSPAGYFVIRSVASNRLLDVHMDDIEDGTEIMLWPEKESSIVETRRSPDANNQVFFIDPSGALCSRSAGHAIDIEGTYPLIYVGSKDDRLVIRHRRPVSLPYPNAYSHPLPTFQYSAETGEITVHYTSDPSHPPPSAVSSDAWKKRTYILALQHRHRLAEDEVLEEERGEEAEVDDSPEWGRKVRVLGIREIIEKARNRRRWQITAIRKIDARTV